MAETSRVSTRDGYVWPAGRADDVMNAGGFRVSPLEVEAALAGHPAVADVAVAERAVRPDVQVIAAYVVPRAGAAADADAILAFAATHLAAYKRPRQVDLRRCAAALGERQGAPPRTWRSRGRLRWTLVSENQVSRVMVCAPVFTSSPVAILISTTLPAKGDGTST